MGRFRFFGIEIDFIIVYSFDPDSDTDFLDLDDPSIWEIT